MADEPVDGDEGRLVAAGTWTETAFDRGTFGPESREGFTARFERGTGELEVAPVRFERSSNREQLSAIAATSTFESAERTAVAPDVPPRTGFAAVAHYRPGERTRTDVFTIAHDAGDALAAVLWLTAASETEWELERNLRLHRGQAPSATDVAVSDDDALGALFAETADTCVLTGVPTRSHELTLPYRYLPALENVKRTPRGVLRVPTTVHSLVGAVSHGVWEDRALGDCDPGTPIERRGKGEYRLAGDVIDAISGLDASAFVLHRLDDPG